MALRKSYCRETLALFPNGEFGRVYPGFFHDFSHLPDDLRELISQVSAFRDIFFEIIEFNRCSPAAVPDCFPFPHADRLAEAPLVEFPVKILVLLLTGRAQQRRQD